MLDIGSDAPDFTVPATDPNGSGERSTFRLSEALADGPVLLNFYLFDFHPACAANMCTLRDLSWFDLDPNLSVAGISTDSAFSHAEFATQDGLTFPLLSDSDGTVAESYDVLYDDVQGHKRVAKRSVFLVDRERTIRYAWAGEQADVQPDWEEIKREVESLSTIESA